MKTALLALALVSTGVVAESMPFKNDNYKWHDAGLTNGQTAVIKGDWHINDAIRPEQNIRDSSVARMFIERIVIDGRRAIKLFEVHQWPVCPQSGTCVVVVGRLKYRSSSSINYESVATYRGTAKSDKFGNGYITNDDMVELLWNDVAFNLNTITFAAYNNGNPASFSERANENMTVLSSNSDAGFDKMGDNAWTGIVRNTTDGFWSNLMRSTEIRKAREQQNAVSAPRVVIIEK